MHGEILGVELTRPQKPGHSKGELVLVTFLLGLDFLFGSISANNISALTWITDERIGPVASTDK